jgi:AbrB family transcriptional regulator (stage V sporulation protein T)
MVCVTDLDAVVAAAGGAQKHYMGKTISRQLEEAIQERESMQTEPEDRNHIRILEETEETGGVTVSPILSEGDSIGAVVLMSRDGIGRMGEAERKLASTAATFLGRQMEA